MNSATSKGVHHIGLTVSKLEESAAFYVSLLGWREVKRNMDYPAIYVSDGNIMLSLWKNKKKPEIVFDRNRNIGLHHLAFSVSSELDLALIHDKLIQSGVTIEFSPELLGQGPAMHLMCYEPSGIRVEFIWPGN